VVDQYTESLETQHAYVKEAVDVTFPQNIKILQAVLEKVREKIQRLEKAITTQRAKCQAPCKVSCPIPVVSGKECEDIIRKGGEDSQMYLIRPDPLGTPYKVFCDQTSQKGGKSTSFKRTPNVTQDLKIMFIGQTCLWRHFCKMILRCFKVMEYFQCEMSCDVSGTKSDFSFI